MTLTPALTLSINGDRLNTSIARLSQIGHAETGGIDRVAYRPADIEARNLIQHWMTEAGMSVRLDTAGNIIGRYAGTDAHAPALATGSHIDTVPNGGRYDGAYGVLAGLEVVRSLNEHQKRLHHPVEVIVFTDEESSMIGSKAIAGHIVPNPSYYGRLDGTSIQTCLAQIGGDWGQIATAQRRSEEIAAFVELHVEQGPVLETAGVQIGIVEGIVGQRRYYIYFGDGYGTPRWYNTDGDASGCPRCRCSNCFGCEPDCQSVWTTGGNRRLDGGAAQRGQYDSGTG